MRPYQTFLGREDREISLLIESYLNTPAFPHTELVKWPTPDVLSGDGLYTAFRMYSMYGMYPMYPVSCVSCILCLLNERRKLDFVRWEFSVVRSSLVFMRWECLSIKFIKIPTLITSFIKVYMRQAKGSGSMNKSPMHPCTTAPSPKCTNAPMNYYRGLSVKYLR